MGPPGGTNRAEATQAVGARRATKRRLTIGAAVTALGLVCSLEIAQAYDATGDGPVGTDPETGGLLDSDLGESIVADRSTYAADDGRTYWIENHLDASLLPTDVLDGLGLGDAVPDLPVLGGGDAGGDGAGRRHPAASTSWCGPATTTSSTAAAPS